MTFRRFSPTDPATLATLLNRLGDDLTEDISTAAGKASWATITGKPTNFPPAAHQHTLAGVDGLTAALDGKVDDDDARLTNARRPTAHQHALADVDGLTARLAALERDTGWRSLPHTGSRGAAHVRRVGHTVTLRLVDFAPAAGSFATNVLYLPPGFQYSGYGTFLAIHPSWAEPASIYGHYSGANIAWLRTINDTPARPVQGQYAEYRFTTANAWPTALPGTPA